MKWLARLNRNRFQYKQLSKHSLMQFIFCTSKSVSASVRTSPGVYSASNRNEYQKHKNNNVSGELSAAGA
jgi:hypothetical protein